MWETWCGRAGMVRATEQTPEITANPTGNGGGWGGTRTGGDLRGPGPRGRLVPRRAGHFPRHRAGHFPRHRARHFPRHPRTVCAAAAIGSAVSLRKASQSAPGTRSRAVPAGSPRGAAQRSPHNGRRRFTGNGWAFRAGTLVSVRVTATSVTTGPSTVGGSQRDNRFLISAVRPSI